ncbi:MAG: DeoR/GlpR transcriptional regulator [Lentisphaeria bacterium]|nr:DeoR/GlpR transcriptional regulator [Lentisphaeria bacterium]
MMGPERTRKLLSAERESLICRSLTAGVRTISELSNELQVSEATVRRDLETLEKQGVIRRVYGGAELLRKRHTEPLYEEKASLHALEKARIAEAAVKFIQEGDTIFLDGGSTVLEMARRLPSLRDLTVVTNSLMAAAELMEKNFHLILVGGAFRSLSRTLVGPLTSKILESLTISKAFLGTIGLEAERGISTTDPNEAYTKELVMKRSDKVFLLADSSKFGVSSFVFSGDAGDIDVLVTDSALSQAAQKQLKTKNIEVILT